MLTSWTDRTARSIQAKPRVMHSPRQHWLKPEWLAKYAPELNDIEHEWKTLKGHHLAHKTFKTADSLKTAIDEEVKAMNANRNHRPLAKQLDLCLAGCTSRALMLPL